MTAKKQKPKPRILAVALVTLLAAVTLGLFFSMSKRLSHSSSAGAAASTAPPTQQVPTPPLNLQAAGGITSRPIHFPVGRFRISYKVASGDPAACVGPATLVSDGGAVVDSFESASQGVRDSSIVTPGLHHFDFSASAPQCLWDVLISEPM